MNETKLTELPNDAPVLETVEAVVKLFGGPTAMGRALGCGPNRVSNWLTWGRFPDRATTYREIHEVCAARGYRVDVQLFHNPSEAVA